MDDEQKAVPIKDVAWEDEINGTEFKVYVMDFGTTLRLFLMTKLPDGEWEAVSTHAEWRHRDIPDWMHARLASGSN